VLLTLTLGSLAIVAALMTSVKLAYGQASCVFVDNGNTVRGRLQK
jgi:hypothetical protein